METKPFALLGYPFGQDDKFLRKRFLPAWLRHGTPVIVGTFVATLILNEAAASVWPGLHLGSEAWLAVCIATSALWIWHSITRRNRLISATIPWDYLVESHTAHIKEEGLFLHRAAKTELWSWRGLRNVIRGPNGLLVEITPLSCIPIPAAAFGSDAEMVSFMDAANARIGETRE